jgi:hypothetical protein
MTIVTTHIYRSIVQKHYHVLLIVLSHDFANSHLLQCTDSMCIMQEYDDYSAEKDPAIGLFTTYWGVDWYVNVPVCMYVCMYVCVEKDPAIALFTTYWGVEWYVCVPVCLCAYIHVYIHICVCVCLCVYIYI